MKKLLLILGIAIAACGPYVAPPPVADPCDQSVFDEALCQAAIMQQGYYYNGGFVHVHYVHPYNYYYGTHKTYISHGGRWVRPNATIYSRTYVPRSYTSTRVVVPQTRVVAPSPYTPRSGAIRGMSMSRTYSRPSSPRSYSGRRR